MPFLDSSLMIYATLVPKLEPSPKIQTLKSKARVAYDEIMAGREAATSVVHLNEVANMLANSKNSRGGMPYSHEVVGTLLANPYVRVLDVTEELYGRALELARSRFVEVADALAYLLMREVLGTNEAYTFDKDDYLKLDARLTLLPA